MLTKSNYAVILNGHYKKSTANILYCVCCLQLLAAQEIVSDKIGSQGDRADLQVTGAINLLNVEKGGSIYSTDRMHLQSGNGAGIWLNPFANGPVIIGGPGASGELRLEKGLPKEARLLIEGVATVERLEITGQVISTLDRLHITTGNSGAVWINPFSQGPLVVGGPGSYGELKVVTGTVQEATLEVEGTATVKVLEITGGADMCERFSAQPGEEIPIPGSVVSYDEKGNQNILMSSQEYDRKVAGVVSGGDGINPGISLGQANSLADGEIPIAMSGRVRCLADATYGSIAVGDLMTTSPTPGHAMKVLDRERSVGAVIGKSTSRLESGRGFIWLHVTLQ